MPFNKLYAKSQTSAEPSSGPYQPLTQSYQYYVNAHNCFSAVYTQYNILESLKLEKKKERFKVQIFETFQVRKMWRNLCMLDLYAVFLSQNIDALRTLHSNLQLGLFSDLELGLEHSNLQWSSLKTFRILKKTILIKTSNNFAVFCCLFPLIYELSAHAKSPTDML